MLSGKTTGRVYSENTDLVTLLALNFKSGFSMMVCSEKTGVTIHQTVKTSGSYNATEQKTP